jgi:hypothetical protein
VPLIAYAAGDEDEWKLNIRNLGGIALRGWMKARAAVRGVEAMIDIEARRSGMAWRGAGPLHWALPQPFIGEAGNINWGVGGQALILFEDLFRFGERESARIAHVGSQPRPISQSGNASPGGASNRGKNDTLRSELVITPSFSGHCAAGSRTSANFVVWFG